MFMIVVLLISSSAILVCLVGHTCYLPWFSVALVALLLADLLVDESLVVIRHFLLSNRRLFLLFEPLIKRGVGKSNEKSCT